MLFNRRCQCGRKHTHEKTVGTDWGDLTTRYCSRCWEEGQESDRLLKAETAERIRIRKEEEKKQKEYELLKREVEMMDLKRRKEVYSNCYKCGDDLVEGQVIIAVHQYFYCSGKCLERDKKAIMLGDGK